MTSSPAPNRDLDQLDRQPCRLTREHGPFATLRRHLRRASNQQPIDEPLSGPVATARQQSQRVTPDSAPPSQSRRRRWALVPVWDDTVLASFDDETSARDAMTGADADEVVVLHGGT